LKTDALDGGDMGGARDGEREAARGDVRSPSEKFNHIFFSTSFFLGVDILVDLDLGSSSKKRVWGVIFLLLIFMFAFRNSWCMKLRRKISLESV
jgi:hypothetical protein